MRSRFLRLGGGLAAAAMCVIVLTALAAAGSGATRASGTTHARLDGNNAPGQPTGLSVGDRPDPLNVEGTPQFGWFPQDVDGNEVQTAYEIQVTKDSDGSVVWDSGKVSSSDESYVPYAGPTLADGTSYSWSVRTWDHADAVSPWANISHFDTGIKDNEWGATWIRRATTGNDSTVDYTLARKQFTISDPGSPVVRARIYSSAMAEYELHINGQAIYRGDSFDYPGEGQYAVNDITSQARAAQAAGGAAANQLAVGMLYYYHTCTCQGRANGPPSNSSTLAAASSIGDTVVKLASVSNLVVGDMLDVDTGANQEVRTITAVGTSGAGGTGVTLDSALTLAHASGVATVSPNGPSGMLVRVVVDHADGTRDVFVSDGTWKVTKDTAYTNTTNTQRNSDAGDYVERYDATQEIPGWDTVGFNDSAWSAPQVIGPHPRPVSTTQDRFSHLDGNVSGISYQTLHPVSVTTLADGTVVADFGKVISAVPVVHFHNGVAGKAISMATGYIPVNTTLSAATAVGATNIKVASVSNFSVGDPITVDGMGPGHPTGDPETRTITSVGTTGAGGTGIGLSSGLNDVHASGAYVVGTRTSQASVDDQGSNTSWFYTEKNGDQTAQAFTYWGWRYLQINAPGPGETLTSDDISAVLQHTDAPADRTATFNSGNSTLDNVFTMLQRSGLYASQETGVDTPTREKGQFLGDVSDYGVANMAASGERNATKRMIREFIYSGVHSWKATASGYCATAPCSYPGYGPLSAGRLNAVYPNGDNMRDIPDYTELWPQLVWNYYLNSGDKATLASAYASLQADVSYVHNAEPASGNAAGLTWLLPGGTGSYQNGIIDWPSRLGYVFTNNGARTIHADEAVGVYRLAAKAAAALGNTSDETTYNGYADALTAAINAKQRIPGDTLYSDGLQTTTTTTSAATVVGATNIKVASTTPFTVGDTLSIDFANGALKELATITSVGTSGSGGTGIGITPALTKAHASGVTIGTSSSTKLYPASTTLAANTSVGDTNIKVNSVSGFTATEGSESNAGPTLIVGVGGNREVRRITAVGTTGAGGTGITLSSPLTIAHSTGDFVATPSQQAQTFSIFDGVAPQSDWSSMADYMSTMGLRSAPMDWGETMDALGMADRPDAIVNMMTNTAQFGPGQVLASGGTWIWEDWTITGTNSMSHGWGARGINSMLTYLLGISVTSPGAATVLIAPPDKGLNHVSGSMWTQRGTVTSNWTRSTGNAVTLDMTVPDNQTATVSLPTTDANREYTASGAGAPVFQSVSNGRETYTVGSGASHFALDTTAPVTTAVLAPPTPNGTNGWYTTPVGVTLVPVDEDGGSGIQSTQYNLDGTGWVPYTAPFTVSAEGPHTLLFNSTDNAGNVEANESVSFQIDTVKPVTTSAAPCTSPGLNGWCLVPVQVTLNATDATSGVASTQYTVDGGSPQTANPFTVSADGDHAVKYWSTDNAGNAETDPTIEVKVDQNNPVTTASISPAPPGGYYASPTVTLTGDDGTGSGVAQIAYKIDSGAWVTHTGSGPVVLSSFSTGSHVVQMQATDNAGRLEAVHFVAFAADSTPPTVTITTPPDGSVYTQNSTKVAKFKCTDNQAPAPTCVGTQSPGPASLTNNVTDVDTSTVGPHTVTVVGTDGAGNVTTVVSHYTVVYQWNGFGTPVHNSSDQIVNLVHAGDRFKIKFGLGAETSLSVLAGTPTWTTVPCSNYNTWGQSLVGASPTVPIGLSYGQGNPYVYGVQTTALPDATWAGTCQQFSLQLNDGTAAHTAVFMFFS